MINKFNNNCFLNCAPMLQNVQRERMGVSLCQLDLENSLPAKRTVNDNSWFAFGRFEIEPEHFVNFLFHIMSMELPIVGEIVQSLVTVFDESTGEYYAKDYLHRGKKVTVSNQEFLLEVPCGKMAGDWNTMEINFHEGDFQLDITASAIHYPILIGANSIIDMCDMCIHEYSVPRMLTKGTMSIHGKRYPLDSKGYIWFDRQWQNINYRKSTMKWSWIAVSLDNGEI